MVVLSAVMTRPAPSPSSVRSDLPVWIDIVLRRALAKSPEDRYDSMSRIRPRPAAAGAADQTTVILDAAPARSRRRSARDLRRGPSSRTGPHGRRGLPRHPPRARPSGRDPAVAPRIRAGLERGPAGACCAKRKTLQIAHPSIIHVRDYGEEGDLIYVVTDYIEGRSLREVLRADGPMPWTRLRPLLAQLIEAAGVLHRRHGLLCGMSPDIMRLTPDDDAERLMISSAGIWQAQDLLATLQDADAPRRRPRGLGTALRRAGAPHRGERRRCVGHLHHGGARVRDGDGHAAVSRRVDAGASRKDADRYARGSTRAPTKPAPGRCGRYREGARTDARATLPDRARLRAGANRLMQNAECRKVFMSFCIVHCAFCITNAAPRGRSARGEIAPTGRPRRDIAWP